MRQVLDDILNSRYDSFFLIAGPCAVESRDICETVAMEMKAVCSELDIPYIFKASIKKANRTKVDSFKGIGDQEALNILSKIQASLDLAITTDVHDISDVALVGEIIDLIQIPAFLCRQTELILAAAGTGKAINIKKGQFMNGEAMLHAADKVKSVGNQQVLLTERGNSFGYDNLIVDSRNIEVMSKHAIVVMDTTHATQRPNQIGGISGGNPEEVDLMGRIGLSAGARGIFMEVHPDPPQARSDASSMIPLNQVRDILIRWKHLSTSIREIYG